MQNGTITFSYLTINICDSIPFLLHLTSSSRSFETVFLYLPIFPAHQKNMQLKNVYI